MKEFYLGLDVGGTKCAIILGRCGTTMEILDRIAFPTEAKKGFDHTIQNIYAAIEEMMARHSLSADNVQALGISCGGPLNSKTGRVLSPPNLFGWDDIPIVEMMEARYGIPTALQNDANACALAEWRFGAGRGFTNVIFCTFGTGMVAGLILDGRLYEGTTGMAGEIGHLRLSEHGPVGFGKEGSFEGFCSGGGIAQLARTKVLQALQMGIRPSFCPDVQLLDTLSAKSVAEAAHAGDELAKSIFQECGFYLGRGLSLLIDIINPEVIVLGSIY
ncbi:MAG: ROK family protein, partial [Clostridia bacterium]|nr:ROK family protein [Clostridia bacterium]